MSQFPYIRFAHCLPTLAAALALFTLPAAAAAPTSDQPAGMRTFIVVLKPHAGDPGLKAARASRAMGGQVVQVYRSALRGFALRLPAAAANAFLADAGADAEVDLVDDEVAMGVGYSTQAPTPSWGLDRVDRRALGLDNSYTYASAGLGVTAYVVDTGILASHADFGGRVASGYSAISGGTSDCNGHGTHVAGTIGGSAYGVAKQVTLVPVRVLDCNGSGTNVGVIAGLDWVAANGVKPAVVNMSLGGGASSALDQAVRNVVAKGITVVVAAGNSNQNACNYSPAREPAAITVGATGSNDGRASYSNFGTCLDLFAPGSSIVSTWITSTTSAASLSGTSMAAPHVAGLVALMLTTRLDATPADIDANVKGSATANLVGNAGTGSPNRLMFADWANSYQPSAPPPPLVASVASLSGRAAKSGKNWKATVTVAVRDAAGVAVAGAVATGNFSVGGSGLRCTTDTTGHCAITSGNLSSAVASTTFSGVILSGTSLVHDTAGDQAKSVTVARP